MNRHGTASNKGRLPQERPGKRPSWGDFVLRLLTTLIILPLIVFLIWAPGLEWAFAGFIAMLAAVALYEYYSMARSPEIAPETIGGLVSGAIVTLSGYSYDLKTTVFIVFDGCFLVAGLHLVHGQPSIAGLATSVFGIVYVGWFAAHMVLLHGIPQIGPALVTMLVAAVALTDAAAYLAGSAVGKHRMAPTVSPNKTWEGAIAGFAAAVLGVTAFYFLGRAFPALSAPRWSLAQFLCTGAILSVVAQMGDLVESSMKRSAGVKDSGFLFPGHGGVLDRSDGYLFAAPVLYYMVTFFFHA